MTMRFDSRPALAGLLLLGILAAGISVVPTVQAAPPTLDCEVNYIPTAATGSYREFYPPSGFFLHNPLATLANGQVVFSLDQRETLPAGGGASIDSIMRKVNTSCATLWSSEYDCPSNTGSGGSNCSKGNLIADPAGHIVAYRYLQTPTGSTAGFQHINSNTGSLLATTSELNAASICTTITCYTAGDAYIDAGIVKSAIPHCCANDFIRIVSDDAFLPSVPTNFHPFGITVENGTTDWGYVTGYSGTSTPLNFHAVKLNLGTGAANSLTYSFNVAGSWSTPLKPGQADPTKVFGVYYAGGPTANRVIGFTKIDKTAWTQTSTNIAVFGTVDNRATGWDLAGDDSLLVCGRIDNGAPSKAFVARINTTTGLKDWHVEFTPNGVPGSAIGDSVDCAFDYQGGFYTITTYSFACSVGTCLATSLRHWSGGGFVTPTPELQVDLYDDGTTPVTPGTTVGTTDLGTGLKGFFESICGTSGGALFFCGMVLVVVEMVVVAALVAAVTRRAPGAGQALGISTGIVGEAGMLFNALIGLWPAWSAVVLMALAAGLILAIMNKIQFGGATPSVGGEG